MDMLYLIAFLVGGFFVALSVLGGADTDVDADFDTDFDTGADADVGVALDTDVSYDIEMDGGQGLATNADLVDLFSVRALFLFTAFFGLTGLSLSWAGSAEPWTGVYAVLVGLVVGLGGNFVIKRVGYAHVSSDLSTRDLTGLTARVLVPFEGPRKGKIRLDTRGHRLHVMATAFEELGAFHPDEEVVIVRMKGPVAEVVKPD